MTADFAKAAIRAMTQDDLSGGTVTYGNEEYPASIGVFTTQDILTVGGWSKKLMATVTMCKADTNGVEFSTQNEIAVTLNGEESRACGIENVRDMGALIEIDVSDKNQGA
jgi:hypothetical protein